MSIAFRTRRFVALRAAAMFCLAPALVHAEGASSETNATTATIATEPSGTNKGPKVKDDSYYVFDIYMRGVDTTTGLHGGTSSGFNFEVGQSGTLAYRMESKPWVVLHLDYDYAIGGGDADVSGIARTYGYVGFERSKGTVRPFLRLGAGFDYRVNDAYLYSHLDAPATQLGFTMARDDFDLDLGMLFAWTATGRFSVGEDERRLDGDLSGGAFLELRGKEPFMVRMEARTYALRSSGQAPREVNGRACTALLGPMICLDGAVISGDLPTFADTPNATIGALQPGAVYYSGISMGYGAVTTRN